MVSVKGPSLSTPLSPRGRSRSVVDRSAAPLAPQPGDLFLRTHEGRAALRPRPDGLLDLVATDEDPRTDGERPACWVGRRDGRAVWAVELDEEFTGEDDMLVSLRTAAEQIAEDAVDAALSAVALGAWHRRTRFCSACGSRLEATRSGWSLRCPRDGSEHFPRTDPAVIMAVRDEQDRLLLARAAGGRFHSVLAGFVEAGESAESTVVREVAEEVSVTVTDVEYVGSQPWPFPRSLMLGFRAWARDREDLVLQPEEIARAAWFSREQLRSELAEGGIELPGQASLGRALIRDWYGETLPDED